MCVAEIQSETNGEKARGPVLQWLGHASIFLEDRGTTVLTDPLLTARVAHLRRRRGPVPVLSAVHDPDVVLLSHLHADHTHLPSLRLLSDRVPIVVPAGAPDALPKLREVGAQLIEVGPGDQVTIGGLSVLAVPADHDGRRWRRGPQKVPALGYVIDGDKRTYFAGDTDLYGDMAAWISDVDLALLPVAGWGPTLGAGHMDPARAALAAEAVSARRAVPIHFGTLWPIGMGRVRSSLFHGPGAEFVRLAEIAGLNATEMLPGSTIRI